MYIAFIFVDYYILKVFLNKSYLFNKLDLFDCYTYYINVFIWYTLLRMFTNKYMM